MKITFYSTSESVRRACPKCGSAVCDPIEPSQFCDLTPAERLAKARELGEGKPGLITRDEPEAAE